MTYSSILNGLGKFSANRRSILMPAGRDGVVAFGSIGKPLTATDVSPTKPEQLREFKNALKLPTLSMNQIHCDRIATFDVASVSQTDLYELFTEQKEVDGLLILNIDKAIAAFSAIVWTADCIPIIAFGKRHALLLHVGWRGLANGIIAKGFSMLAQAEDSVTDVYIGPCADPEHYQVGYEVVDQITNPSLVFIDDQSEHNALSRKYLLDLVATAKGQIPDLNYRFTIASQQTISDSGWYSHRKEPLCHGRNISYLAVG